jgi:hypothetical protein
VTVDVLKGNYITGKKASADFINNVPIVFDEILPRWNYCAIPKGADIGK